MIITEVREERERYGNDATAINKHSVRTYEVEGFGDVRLSRTLDGCPPFFELYYFKAGAAISTSIPVDGGRYFGDGLTWREAEAKMREAMESGVARERLTV